MAKRFIQPDWKKLRLLPGYLQRAWFYIWDKADDAGVYHYDEEYFKLDLKLEQDVPLAALGELPECQILPGYRILIKNFLAVNYVKLKLDYNPHKPAFRAIEKNGLTLNSSLNQASLKLEEEGEDEEEDKVEGSMKETNHFEPKGIVADMAKNFQDVNPKYPPDKNLDFPALGEIAIWISMEQKLSGGIVLPKNKTPILKRWGELVKHIKADPHLCKYSLTQINKHFQSVVQSFNNGSNGNYKQNHQRGPVITGTAEGAGPL